MPIKMEEFTKVFPRRVNIDQYKALIDGALNAARGDDGLPRVAAETFMNHKDATKAANAIRNHCKANKIDLHVSCPENLQVVYVYKSGVPRKTRQKKAVATGEKLAGTEQAKSPESQAAQAPA